MVDILMATYNGEQYLEEQLSSIIKQSFSDWTLYIRDDGSTDKTMDILLKYEQKLQGKLIIINDSKKNLGVKKNFEELLRYSKANYCMFADQDDVWIKEKIDLTLRCMRKNEEKYGQDIPIVINTDLRIVDENLKMMEESFWKHFNIKLGNNGFNKILVENVVTGCTMMINKKLKEYIKKIPEESVMHDWWIALIGASFGVIDSIPIQTILYRQHGNNQIGAYNSRNFEVKLQTEQAKAFYYEYRDQLNSKNKNILESFMAIETQGFCKKRVNLVSNKFFSNRFLGNIKNFIFI